MRKLLALADVQGKIERLREVLDAEATSVDAVALVGDLAAPWSVKGNHREILQALGRLERPAFWVPGRNDAPLRRFLQDSHNAELVHPLLHGVHGTYATASGGGVVAGIGGEIVDEPETVRAEDFLLRYPGWEAEYRLKLLSELNEQPAVLLFATPPEHKGLGDPGSQVVAELIKLHAPRVAVVGGGAARQERLARTLVVCPGRLADGDYALVNLQAATVEPRHLHGPAAVAT